MAKTAQEKTPAQLATLDARQKVETATKNDTAKSTDATKKHLSEAQAHLKKCIHDENRERFVRVAGGRVIKGRVAIRNLANVAQPRSYVYTEADVAKAETTLSAELKATIDKMRAALTRAPGAAKTEDDFTF
jgi:hypothetical protein